MNDHVSLNVNNRLYEYSRDRQARPTYLGDCELTSSCRAGQLYKSCPVKEPTGALTALCKQANSPIANSWKPEPGSTQLTSAALFLSWGYFYSFLFLIQFHRGHMSAKLSSPDSCTYLNIANVLLIISRNGDLKPKMYLHRNQGYQ